MALTVHNYSTKCAQTVNNVGTNVRRPSTMDVEPAALDQVRLTSLAELPQRHAPAAHFAALYTHLHPSITGTVGQPQIGLPPQSSALTVDR